MSLNERQHIQLLVLPGLGGDHRMAYPQLSLPYSLITPDYIELEASESLTNFAKRFGEHLFAEHAIDPTRPLFIAGYSFGSVVAQEMTHFFPCEGIILIGGLRSGHEFRPFVGWFGRKIASHVPLIVYHGVGLVIPFFLRRISEIPEAEILLCQQMYLTFPYRMFRRVFGLLAHWEGCSVRVPMLRIHGAHDQIISNIHPDETSIVIEGAKHLVAFAKPGEVNREVERFVDGLSTIGRKSGSNVSEHEHLDN